MDILDVKRNMNKKVYYEGIRSDISGEYILSAIVCEMTKAGDWIYSVRLSDPERNCVYETTLERISERKGIECQ